MKLHVLLRWLLIAVVVVVAGEIVLLCDKRMREMREDYEAMPQTLTTDVGYLGGKVEWVESVSGATIYPSAASFRTLAKTATRTWVAARSVHLGGGSYPLRMSAVAYLDVEGTSTLYARSFVPPSLSYTYLNNSSGLIVQPDGKVGLVWQKAPYFKLRGIWNGALHGLGWILCLVPVVICLVRLGMEQNPGTTKK